MVRQAVPLQPMEVHSGADLQRETGVKLSPGRREGWGEGALRSGFSSYYPTLI